MKHCPQGASTTMNLVDPLRATAVGCATGVTSDECAPTHLEGLQHPAYESSPSSVQNEPAARGRRPPFHQRLSGFYKPAKQRSSTQEPKRNASLNGNKTGTNTHRKVVSLSVNLGGQNSAMHNAGGGLVSPLDISGLPRLPSHPFALPSGWIKRVASPTRDMLSSPTTFSKNAVLASPVPTPKSPFVTSARVAEGMLHPNGSVKEFKGYTLSHTYEGNCVSRDGDVSGESRFSTLVSSTSHRSKTPSIIRPLSGLFSKSTDVLTDGQWNQRPLDRLARSWSSSPTGHLREGSSYFEQNGEHTPGPVKSKSWAKFLNGYVSPRSHSRVLVASTRRRKSVREGGFDLSNGQRKRGRSIREVPLQAIRVLSRRLSSGWQQSTAPQQSSGTVAVAKTKLSSICNSRFLLCSALLHIVLFWICPPSQAVALGGYGMLTVYGMLAIGLACVSWMIFEDEALVTPVDGKFHQP